MANFKWQMAKVLTFALMFASRAWALGGVPGKTDVSTSVSTPLSLDADRFSVLAGGELLHMGPANAWLPALAVRYRLGAQGWWPDAIEAGGALPTNLSAGFHQDSFNFYPVLQDRAQIDSVAEAHVAGVWEFCRTTWVVPELSLGISVGRFHNEAVSGAAGFPDDETHTSVSQLTQVGATVPITKVLGFHADLGYVRYDNHIWGAGGEHFDLFVSALTIRTMLQIRL